MACAGEAMTALLPSVYVCPNCKTPLVDLYCASCAHQYELSNGFPKLMWNDAQYESTPEIIDAYDSIYSDHSGVWENQGRSREFIQYFAGLLRRYDARRLLEVGCGEGVLLAALAGSDLYGTELSTKALERARTNVSANLCIALGERLPFCDQYFDLIASVGVMEHFLDDRAASREICRVLKDGGHYVVLIHVHLTAWQSVRQKISEYVYPRPHPILLGKWLLGKLYRPIRQPVQNNYAMADARACLEQSGFSVEEVIHKGNTKDAPLIGPHVVIYVCRKSDRTQTTAQSARSA